MNKEKQKNFIHFDTRPFHHRAKRTKGFLVLFFKKELLVFIDFSVFPGGLGVTFLFTKKELLSCLLPERRGCELSLA